MVVIRRLESGEGELYRALRLRALLDAPDAFTTTYEDAAGRSTQSWCDQADSSACGSDRATFVAMVDQPVGLAALYRDPSDERSGELLQMWLAPECRGGSLGKDLLDEVFKWAGSNDFSSVRAEVTAGNSRALRFYLNYGFEETLRPGGNPDAAIVLTKSI